MSKEFEAALAHVRKVDKRLAKVIDQVGPCGLERKPLPVFQALTRSIVYQQLSGKAASSILKKVVALAPESRGFPKPEMFLALTDQELRGAGLSGQKLGYLKGLCAAAVDGRLPTSRALAKMSDEDIIEALTGLKGIGRWSVEMLLIFNLGRPDVLPATDYGVRKGFATVYKHKELPKPREILEFGERWRPYRTLPSWYLWRALELKAGKD